MIKTSRGKTRRTIEEINITPFTDVCLVLLIIFMVTMPKITLERSMKLNLPQAANQNTRLPAPVTVSITHDHQIWMNDQHIASFYELANQLGAINKKDGSRRLELRGDEGIPYQFIVTAIDVAGKAGFDQVSMTVNKVTQNIP